MVRTRIALTLLAFAGCGFDSEVPLEPGGGDRNDTTVDASVPDLPPSVVYRVNVKGAAYSGIDFAGDWAEDTGVGGVCSGNDARHEAVFDKTNDSELFRGEAWDWVLDCQVGDGTLPSGPYTVSLYFAELVFGDGCDFGGGVGSRVFDIHLEGVERLKGLDIYAEVGCIKNGGSPLVKSFDVDIDDGALDISLPATSDAGKISAIELISKF